MALQLYNTLIRKKETFAPLDPANVRMYVCGPTVYARPHLGNARSVVVYDVLYRLLRHIHGENHVTYVRNITDVDDKINKAAMENGETIQALTHRVTGWFHDDMDALNCLRPTHEPRATQYIPHMIAMIEKLIKNGNAYVAEGHVLFSVESRVASRESGWVYGQLSGRTTEEQQAGARVAVESYKKHPGDFVLWKPADAEDDASSTFDSPWGVGRPGWHIECSAMSTDLLGETFDIHGGGADLKFPHHENEIAQSCCANPGSQFAKTWVHNGFLTVNGEKMAKSLGNFITVRDLLDQGVHGEVIRLALLSTHYGKPLDWTDALADDAESDLFSFVDLLYGEKAMRFGDEDYTENSEATALVKAFFNALEDDMNISVARVQLFKARDTLNRLPLEPTPARGAYLSALKEMTSTLGIATKSYSQWKGAQLEQFGEMAESIDVNGKVEARAAAKAAKNWAEADRIRDELKAQGIILEDRPDGTTDWRRA